MESEIGQCYFGEVLSKVAGMDEVATLCNSKGKMIATLTMQHSRVVKNLSLDVPCYSVGRGHVVLPQAAGC